MMIFLCFKQKTAYEMRISDWSSDVCSSDLSFATDVENDFFDRTDDPGDMSLAIMRPSTADGGGGGVPAPSAEGDLLNVVRTSPSDGTIKVGVRATTEMNVGDAAEIKIGRAPV